VGVLDDLDDFPGAARFVMNCHCVHCKAYAAWYARERRTRAREPSPRQRVRADSWRRDGSEFLSDDVWTRIWRDACGTAGLPREFTPYNARHTGISWAVAKGADLGCVRQRAGHGSLGVTSRYQAILDEKDTSLAEPASRVQRETHTRASPCHRALAVTE
jgi:integrase